MTSFGPTAPLLFSELVALLPDIALQSALFAAAKTFVQTQANQLARSQAETQLDVAKLTLCGTCGQVVVVGDASVHDQVHAGRLDAASFPALGAPAGAHPIVPKRHPMPAFNSKKTPPTGAWGKPN
jgi:hypothetical protein